MTIWYNCMLDVEGWREVGLKCRKDGLSGGVEAS